MTSAHPPAEDVSEYVLQTPAVQTPAGVSHIDVHAFKLDSGEDLARAQTTIAAASAGLPAPQGFFELTVTTAGSSSAISDELLHQAAQSIQADLKPEGGDAPQSFVVEAARAEPFLKRHYNAALAFVRVFVSGAPMTAGIIMSNGGSIEHALLIGLLAGSISGAVQLKSDLYFRFLENSDLAIRNLQKFGLFTDYIRHSPASRGASALLYSERFTRWYLVELGFLWAVNTAMALLDVPTEGGIYLYLTALMAMASQGLYESFGILRSSKLIRSFPKWANRAPVFTNVMALTGSAASNLSSALGLMGLPVAYLGFGVLLTSGAVLGLAPEIMRAKKQATDYFVRLRTAKAMGRCSALFKTAF